jgi:cell division protein FtsQ
MTGTIARPLADRPLSGDSAASGAPLAARRKLPILIGVTVVVVIAAVWLVAFSPMLGARTVTVTGTHSITADQVLDAAAIGQGTPLIRLDTTAVRHRIEKLLDVATAQVTLAYPSTVHITVTERVPVGYFAQGNGFVLVDKTGAQYRTVVTVPATLPRFALPTGDDARSSGQAVAVAAGALTAPVLSKLAQVSANSPLSITLVLRDGRIVTWGSADRSAEKARLLPALLAQPGTRIDLSNPDLVVVR